jgi:hypothetical protein
MIRPETTTRVFPDPSGLRKLAAFREQISELDAKVDAKNQSVKRFGELKTAQAREKKFAEMHSRMAAEDTMHRPSDRAFPVRPLTISDKDLIRHANIRTWYNGENANAANSLRDTRLSEMSEPRASSLVKSGYLKPVDKADLVAIKMERLMIEKERDDRIMEMFDDPSKNSRATTRSHWRREGPQAHWMDRDAVMQSERRLAQGLLSATHYSHELVNSARPFKADYVKERVVQIGDSKSYRDPLPHELLAKEAAKFEAARDYDRSFSKARASQNRSSRPTAYFGGVEQHLHLKPLYSDS